MRFSEILRLAFSSLTANKLRSSLTLLGIAVGVFSVIGVMTLINGIRTSAEKGLNVLGANSFQILKYPALTDWSKFPRRRDMTFANAMRFKELMGDSARVSLMLGRGGKSVVHQERRTNPNVLLRGTDENFITAFNHEVVAGRNLTLEDTAHGRAVCLIGHDVREKLFQNKDPVGTSVRIEGQNYTVVGVLAKKGASLVGNDNFVVIPITRFLAVYGRQFRSITINVQAADQAALPATEERAIGMMRLVRGLQPENENDFAIASNQSLIETFNKIADLIATGAFVISAIALLAAGVGVMNIMLVSVTERTKEIGIRKSIGATRRSILSQFLAEAVALALIGGVAGVAIGVGVGNLAARALEMAITFPWMWTAIGLGVCGGIGIVFGFYPAWKAASLDPIEALRYE